MKCQPLIAGLLVTTLLAVAPPAFATARPAAKDAPEPAPSQTGNEPREPPAQVDPEFAALYRSLFPGREDDGASILVETAAPHGAEGDVDGILVGPVMLRPALVVGYVRGDATFGSTAEPSGDSYVQIAPRLGSSLSLPVFRGWLRAGYEPTFRPGSSFGPARRASHMLHASLNQPLGSVLALRARARRTWGVLETLEVDPGREYFFGLGRFRSDYGDLGARLKSDGRFDLDLSVRRSRVRFLEPTEFFDHDQDRIRLELGYELGPTLRAGLVYGREVVPDNPQRPEAESRVHGTRLVVSGDLSDTTHGEFEAGYERRTNPNAGPGGERYSGLTADVRLVRELRPGLRLQARARRFTTLSAFEDDGFYVAQSAGFELTAPLPLELSLHTSLGWHRNQYRTAAAGRDDPRRDTLRDWSLSLGRAVTHRAFVRADYGRQRRRSNLTQFDTTTDRLIVQVGIGFLDGVLAR